MSASPKRLSLTNSLTRDEIGWDLRESVLAVQALPVGVAVPPSDDWDETCRYQRQPADGVVRSGHHREQAGDDRDNVRQLQNNPHRLWRALLPLPASASLVYTAARGSVYTVSATRVPSQRGG